MNIKNIIVEENRSMLILKNYAFKREAINHVIYKLGHLCYVQVEFSEYSTKLILEKKSGEYDLNALALLFIEEIKSLNHYYQSKQNILNIQAQKIRA